jgi:hypothetical protein
VNLTFDEVKVFPKFLLSEEEYKDAVINFTMMHSNGYIRRPNVIGYCTVDLSAVHNRSTHEIRARFFPLTRNDSPGEIYGYLKLDILVMDINDTIPGYD